MIKYNYSKEFWLEISAMLNPRTLEKWAIQRIIAKDLQTAMMLMMLAEIGLKIIKKTFKPAQKEITVSLSYRDAHELVQFLLGVSKNDFIKTNAQAMKDKLDREIVNYKPIYQ